VNTDREDFEAGQLLVELGNSRRFSGGRELDPDKITATASQPSTVLFVAKGERGARRLDVIELCAGVSARAHPVFHK